MHIILAEKFYFTEISSAWEPGFVDGLVISQCPMPLSKGLSEEKSSIKNRKRGFLGGISAKN